MALNLSSSLQRVGWTDGTLNCTMVQNKYFVWNWKSWYTDYIMECAVQSQNKSSLKGNDSIRHDNDIFHMTECGLWFLGQLLYWISDDGRPKYIGEEPTCTTWRSLGCQLPPTLRRSAMTRPGTLAPTLSLNANWFVCVMCTKWSIQWPKLTKSVCFTVFTCAS